MTGVAIHLRATITPENVTPVAPCVTSSFTGVADDVRGVNGE